MTSGNFQKKFPVVYVDVLWFLSIFLCRDFWNHPIEIIWKMVASGSRLGFRDLKFFGRCFCCFKTTQKCQFSWICFWGLDFLINGWRRSVAYLSSPFGSEQKTYQIEAIADCELFFLDSETTCLELEKRTYWNDEPTFERNHWRVPLQIRSLCKLLFAQKLSRLNHLEDL